MKTLEFCAQHIALYACGRSNHSELSFYGFWWENKCLIKIMQILWSFLLSQLNCLCHSHTIVRFICIYLFLCCCWIAERQPGVWANLLRLLGSIFRLRLVVALFSHSGDYCLLVNTSVDTDFHSHSAHSSLLYIIARNKTERKQTHERKQSVVCAFERMCCCN